MSTKDRIIDEIIEERDRLLDAYGGLLRWINVECVHESCKRLKGGERCAKRVRDGGVTVDVARPMAYPDIVLCEAARSAVFRAKTTTRGK